MEFSDSRQGSAGGSGGWGSAGGGGGWGSAGGGSR